MRTDDETRAPGGDPAGTLLAGRYRLERLLGRGGFGAVYLARNLSLDCPVAVKLLHATEHDAEAVARFQREARATARLVHPNTVRVQEFGRTDDGRLFMVMEYLEGSTLRAEMARCGPMPEVRVLRIAGQVCKALAEAHESAPPIVHRDVKPENVFLVRVPRETDVVKVLDFGIAKLAGTASLTATGGMLGSVMYMSPEEIQGGAIDGRADLYSLGVTMFEMAAGTLPFLGDSPHALPHAFLYHHVNTPAPRPSAVRPGLSAAFDDLVLALLAKRPDARPRDADAVLEAIEAAGMARTAVVPTAAATVETAIRTAVPTVAATLAAGDRTAVPTIAATRESDDKAIAPSAAMNAPAGPRLARPDDRFTPSSRSLGRGPFEIRLVSIPPDRRIEVMKALRAGLPDLGLSEVKALVNRLPAVVAKPGNRVEVEVFAQALARAGAFIEVDDLGKVSGPGHATGSDPRASASHRPSVSPRRSEPEKVLTAEDRVRMQFVNELDEFVRTDRLTRSLALAPLDPATVILAARLLGLLQSRLATDWTHRRRGAGGFPPPLRDLMVGWVTRIGLKRDLQELLERGGKPGATCTVLRNRVLNDLEVIRAFKVGMISTDFREAIFRVCLAVALGARAS